MCRSPSARQSMRVISENLVSRPVVEVRHLAPAPADLGHVLQQGGLAGVAADTAQSLLDGALRCRRDALSGELRQIPGEALSLRVFDAQGHWAGSLVPPK